MFTTRDKSLHSSNICPAAPCLTQHVLFSCSARLTLWLVTVDDPSQGQPCNGAQSSFIFLSTCAFPGHLLCLTQAQRYGVGMAGSQPFTPHTHAGTGLQPLNPFPMVPFHRQKVNLSPLCTAAVFKGLSETRKCSRNCSYQLCVSKLRLENKK